MPSLVKRIIQIICAIIWCLLAAGPVFGFAALKPILVSEGVYKEKCEVGGTEGNVCTDQDLALNFLFTVACMVTNVCALPVGWILDSYGPKITGIIGAFLIFFGSFCMKFGESISVFDGILAGYTFLALGGPFVFISCFQLANSFPKNSGLILALLTGAFDSSLALFLMYRIIYTNFQRIPISNFFTWYLLVPVFIFVCQIFIMPADSYKTVGTLAKIAETAIDETGMPLDRTLLRPGDKVQDDLRERELLNNERSTSFSQPTISETTSLLLNSINPISRRESTILRVSVASAKSVYELEAEDRLVKSTGGVFGIMHGYSIREQLKSSWFILMTLFTTIQMLRINFFVATIRAQELYFYDNEEIAITINHFFDLALPLGGLCSIPFIGMILDNLSILSILVTLTVTSLFIGVMGILSWIPATYAGIIMLVVYRPFYYTAVSDYCAKIYGFETFGTIYGSIICFSGICNILQQIMDKITKEKFNLNPVPINSLLTSLTAVFGFILIHFVRTQQLKLRRNNLELEAQEASELEVPI